MKKGMTFKKVEIKQLNNMDFNVRPYLPKTDKGWATFYGTQNSKLNSLRVF